MRKIVWLFIFFMMGTYPVGAQTFAPEFAVEKINNNSDTVASDKSANTAENADEDDTSPLVPARVNLQNKEQEKVYDNSVGRVVEYKIVNGKIEYGDPKDRKILVYIENYKVNKGYDGIARCSMRVYVLNDLEERINNLGFKLIWPEIRTSIQMVKLEPGVKSYNNIMLLGDGCFSIDKTPTLEVNRCRVKGKTEEQCAKAVRWFKR